MKYTGTWKKTDTYIWLRTDNPNFGIKAPLELDEYQLANLKDQEVVPTKNLADFVKKHNLAKRTTFTKVEVKF